MFSEIHILQAINSNKLKSPVTKGTTYDLVMLEGLIERGLIKGVKHVPLADGLPQFFDLQLTLAGKERVEYLNTPVKIWNIDRRLVVLGIVVATLAIVVSILK